MITPQQSAPSLKAIARGRPLPTDERVLVMGILNVTPDSFSDGGRYLDPQAACDRAFAMQDEGADVLDVGGESSRPGALPVSDEEELRRIIPVIRKLAGRLRIPISVDTTKARVAQRALDEGVALINDITALRGDPGMGRVIAASGAGCVLMHMQGTPATMQANPSYGDVVREVRAFLGERLEAACASGIRREQIILDPGFGFGKNLRHNMTLLAHLDELHDLGRPLMAGVSRKAFIGRVLERDLDERLPGTAGAVAMAVQFGVRVIRVHEVSPMRDVIRMVEAVLAARAH
jgi:dihydropteroate synthase